MSNVQSMDLTRGNKEYDSQIKNIEGIFAKLRDILDISKYESDFKQIQIDTKNDSSIASLTVDSMPFEGMQMDFENALYRPYIKRLEELLMDIEKELLPFYELHLLSSKIDLEVNEISGDNIQEVIMNTKELIDLLNSLNTHNDNDKKILIDKAYKIIYRVILNEEIFERSDILEYILKLNIPTNRENLGRLLDVDIKKLSEKDLIDNQLRTIKKEGLGDDHLNLDVIRKVVDKTVGEKNSEYQERKRRAISDLEVRINSYKAEKQNSLDEIKDNNTTIRNLYIRKSLLFTKLFSLILIPVVAFSIGKNIGKNASNKITEYKTITRTVDLNTGNTIGEQTEVYDDKQTTYVATIMECGAWRKNPSGNGYIRNVTAYEYIVPEDIPEDYHIKSEDLAGNMLEKYKYVESKDTLTSDDSTVEPTILITETYQDKNQNKKSTKYIIPGSITGIGIGFVLDIVLLLTGLIGIDRTKRMLEELSNDIRHYKLTNQDIKNRLKDMKDEAISLHEEYENLVRRYGTIEEQISFDEIKSTLNKKKLLK